MIKIIKALCGITVLAMLSACAQQPLQNVEGEFPENANIQKLRIKVKPGVERKEIDNYDEFRIKLKKHLSHHVMGRGNGKPVGITVELENVDTHYNPVMGILVGDFVSAKGKVRMWSYRALSKAEPGVERLNDYELNERIAQGDFVVSRNFGGPLGSAVMRSLIDKEDSLAESIAIKVRKVVKLPKPEAEEESEEKE